MTGALTLSGDPTEDLHAATKQYVDNNSGGLSSVSATLTTSAWTLSGDRYQQSVSVAGVTTDATQVILVDCALTGTDLDADATVLEAWELVSCNNVTQGAGSLTFYAYEAPTVNIPVNVGV